MKKIISALVFAVLLISCEKESPEIIDYHAKIFSNNTYVGLSVEDIKDLAYGVLTDETVQLGQTELVYKVIASNFEYTDTLIFTYEFNADDYCKELNIVSLGSNQIQLMYDFTMNYHQLVNPTNASVELILDSDVYKEFNSINEAWDYISGNDLSYHIDHFRVMHETSFSTDSYVNTFYYSGELNGFLFFQEPI